MFGFNSKGLSIYIDDVNDDRLLTANNIKKDEDDDTCNEFDKYCIISTDDVNIENNILKTYNITVSSDNYYILNDVMTPWFIKLSEKYFAFSYICGFNFSNLYVFEYDKPNQKIDI